jgi:uncharacterized 2Fe-2S/4Fe-4S cluster protein (DUF4445 family)
MVEESRRTWRVEVDAERWEYTDSGLLRRNDLVDVSPGLSEESGVPCDDGTTEEEVGESGMIKDGAY